MRRVQVRYKEQIKRIPGVHSAYKLCRQRSEVEAVEWLDLSRSRAVLRVFPRTMLSVPRLMNAYELVRTVDREHIAGDLVECGVWSGGCIGLMGLAHRRSSRPQRRIYLFDSFEGLPQPSVRDSDVIESFMADHPDGSFDDGSDVDRLDATGACRGDSSEDVRRFLTERLGLSPASLVFHVGWFQETVPSASREIDAIAVLRLDGDWYESTWVCLEHLYDKVVEGGFVILDDFDDLAGCRAAVEEFFADRQLDESLLTPIEGGGAFWRKVSRPSVGTV